MKLDEFPDYLRLPKQFSDMEHKVGGSDSSGAYPACERLPRRGEVDRLSKHALQPQFLQLPTDYTESINHRCMRIRAHRCQGSRPVLLKHSLGEVLEIYLMADSDPRRYYIKALEGLHAPFRN